MMVAGTKLPQSEVVEEAVEKLPEKWWDITHKTPSALYLYHI